MRLAKSADVPDPHDGNGSSRAEASGGILIDSLSGFPSDSEAEEEDDGSGGLIAFKQRKRDVSDSPMSPINKQESGVDGCNEKCNSDQNLMKQKQNTTK